MITDGMVAIGAKAIFDSINGKGAWDRLHATSPHRRTFNARSRVCLEAALSPESEGGGDHPLPEMRGVADEG